MRDTILTGVLALCLATQSVMASEDDVELVSRTLFEHQEEDLREELARQIAQVYADLLVERSIKIADLDRFAEILPAHVADPWLDWLKSHSAAACFNANNTGRTAMVAAFLRDLAAQGLTLSDALTAYRSDGADGSNKDPSGVYLSITFSMLCQQVSVAGLGTTIRKQVESEGFRNASSLADVLETGGVADFPNRIVRKNTLAELRGTNR